MDKNINFKVGVEFFAKGLEGISKSISDSYSSSGGGFASDISKGDNIEERSKKSLDIFSHKAGEFIFRGFVAFFANIGNMVSFVGKALGTMVIAGLTALGLSSAKSVLDKLFKKASEDDSTDDVQGIKIEQDTDNQFSGISTDVSGGDMLTSNSEFISTHIDSQNQMSQEPQTLNIISEMSDSDKKIFEDNTDAYNNNASALTEQTKVMNNQPTSTDIQNLTGSNNEIVKAMNSQFNPNIMSPLTGPFGGNDSDGFSSDKISVRLAVEEDPNNKSVFDGVIENVKGSMSSFTSTITDSVSSEESAIKKLYTSGGAYVELNKTLDKTIEKIRIIKGLQSDIGTENSGSSSTGSSSSSTITIGPRLPDSNQVINNGSDTPSQSEINTWTNPRLALANQILTGGPQSNIFNQ